jgi:hypothetical protein
LNRASSRSFSTNNTGTNRNLLIGSVVGSALFVTLSAIVMFYFWTSHRKKDYKAKVFVVVDVDVNKPKIRRISIDDDVPGIRRISIQVPDADQSPKPTSLPCDLLEAGTAKGSETLL